MPLLPLRSHLLALLPLLAPLAASENEAVFHGLGHLDGSTKTSTASGISADGTSICGVSRSSKGTEAFRWREADGLMGIGDLSNSPFISSASAISGDGKYSVGFGTIGIANSRCCRWTDSSAPVKLGVGVISATNGYRNSSARGISDDGTMVVGNSTSEYGLRAFLWDSKKSTTALNNLGVLSFTPTQAGDNITLNSLANGISGDGSVIVGRSGFLVTKTERIQPSPIPKYQLDEYGIPVLGTDGKPIIIGFTYPAAYDKTTAVELANEAFFYTSSDKITALGDLEGGGLGSEAFAASEDGSVIVGYGETDDGLEGTLWINGEIQSVGDLPEGDTNSQLFDVSASGTEAVGTGADANGQAAVIWDAVNGLRKLSDVLSLKGVDHSDWTLTEATGISADGNVIVGNGINPEGQEEAWRLTEARLLFLSTPPLTELTLQVGTTVTIPTSPGNLYQLETSENFGTWTPLGAVHTTEGASNPSAYAVIDPTYTPTRFYRARLLPGSTLSTPPTPILGKGAVLSFPSVPGFVYRLEASSTLVDWTDLVPPIDTSSDTATLSHSIQDPSPADGSPRFFRLSVENAP